MTRNLYNKVSTVNRANSSFPEGGHSVTLTELSKPLLDSIYNDHYNKQNPTLVIISNLSWTRFVNFI